MKILVLTNLYPPDVIGGYELACAQATEALRARGHEVRVLTSAPRGPVPVEAGVERSLRLVDVWNRAWMGRLAPVTQKLLDAESRLVQAFNVRALAQAVAEFRPEVAYVCNLVGLGGLGMIAALEHLAVPWAWQLGDNVPNYVCSVWGRVVPALAEQFGRQARGRFIAVSSRLAQEIESGGVPLAGEVAIIPNWVVGDPPPPRDPATYRPEGALRVVTAGRLTPYKGLDRLIEAVAQLRNAGQANVRLDLYGAVADVGEDHYPRLLRDLGVADLVAFRGAVSHADLLDRYRDYDVFAFPTWDREPFGLGPLEAAAHGGCLPMIAENCGLAEWLVHGVHCLKAPTTAAALADSLAGLADGRVPIAPIARRAAAVAWRDFRVDAVAAQIEGVLARAAGDPRRPPGDADELYRLAILAEKLMQVMVTEAQAAA